MWKILLVNLTLMAAAVVVGGVTVEIAYRGYLWVTEPAKFTAPWNADYPAFGYYDKSHWEYDEELGFVYPPNRTITAGQIALDQVKHCSEVNTINARGNIGPIRGDYDTAALKILLVGDSFPAFIVNGETFPSKLQATLQDKGIDAHILNFGRDGTGILQMFDLAAAKLPEWQPDLLILTFITDDLDRPRIWRTATEVDGEPRILVTDRPDPNPPPERSQDAYVLYPEGDMDWCRKALAEGRGADGVDELVERYRRMQNDALYGRPTPLSLDHSFVAALLLHNDPYATGPDADRPWTLQKITLTDFRQDPGFVAALEKVQASGVPIVMIHLPIAPELAAGSPDHVGTQRALWASLEEAVGQKAARLEAYMPDAALKDPLRLSHSATNHHPSAYGMQVYADAITRILRQAGFLPGGGPADDGDAGAKPLR